MKKKIRFRPSRVFLLGAVAAAMLSGGCVNVDYVGQRFEPLPDDHFVRLFDRGTDYPEEDYRSIGRATVVVPNDYSIVDINEELDRIAREHGADAVKVISISKKLSNTHFRQPQREMTSARRAQHNNLTPYELEFGDRIAPEEKQVRLYKVEVKILLLMERERLEQLLSERRQFIRQSADPGVVEHAPAALRPLTPEETSAADSRAAEAAQAEVRE